MDKDRICHNLNPVDCKKCLTLARTLSSHPELEEPDRTEIEAFFDWVEQGKPITIEQREMISRLSVYYE